MSSRSLSVLAFLLLLPLCVEAQKYAPHEQWPFVYEDFGPGEMLVYGGSRRIVDRMNIGVVDGKAYFVKDGAVMVSTEPVSAVRMGEDDYISARGRLLKVLRKTEHGAVLVDNEVNVEAMNRSDVGYGFKSSVSSTEKRTIMEGANGAALSLRLEHQPFEQLKMQKNAGAELVLKEVKYVYVDGGTLVRALKSEVKDIEWLDRKDLDAFWKQNKVKYSSDDSLAALVEYIYSQKK